MRTDTILLSQQIQPSTHVDYLLTTEKTIDSETNKPAVHISYEIHNDRLCNAVTVEIAHSNSGIFFQQPPEQSNTVSADETLIVTTLMICDTHRLRITNPGPGTATVSITRGSQF